MAALGWCFGGHAVAELARIRVPAIRAMVTFHGVFGGLPELEAEESDGSRRRVEEDGSSEILICHGVQDPFVPDEDLERAL